MTRSRTVATVCLAALLLAGCGGSDDPSDDPTGDPTGDPSSASTSTSTSEPTEDESSADAAPAVDVCGLLTDAEVLAAAGSKSLSFPHQPQDIGDFTQCEWDPSGRDGNVVRVVLAYLPRSPDNISAELESAPAEEGLGEHVREDPSPTDEYLEVVDGDSYLSLSLDDNARLLSDAPAVARALLAKAFARLG